MIDRLSTALLDYGDSHASFTVAFQSVPSAWGTHRHLSIPGSLGWLRADFPYAQARPTQCPLFIGDSSSVGGFATSTHEFPPVNQYALQIERFSRHLLGESVHTWPIEDSRLTPQVSEALFASARSHAWASLPTP